MSYVKSLYHIVIRTRYSKPVITAKYERELYAYIYGFIQNKGCKTIRINGMPDHIHVLVDINPTLSISSFVHDLKISANNFCHKRRDLFPLFEGWEKEYFATSKSENEQEKVRQYIINQKEHHKKECLRDELLRIAKDAGIKINEKYL